MAEDLKKMYRTIMDDRFSPNMEITFVDGGQRQTLFYEKVTWVVDDVQKGLRYGENPGQEAALYKMINGNLVLGETRTIQPGQYLAGPTLGQLRDPRIAEVLDALHPTHRLAPAKATAGYPTNTSKRDSHGTGGH